MIVKYRSSQAAGDNQWQDMWVPNNLRPSTKKNNDSIKEYIEEELRYEMCHEHFRGYIWKRTPYQGINPALINTHEVLVKLLENYNELVFQKFPLSPKSALKEIYNSILKEAHKTLE